MKWSKDERPATLYTRLYVWGMQRARDTEAFEGEQHTLRVARRRQQDGNRAPTRWTRLTTRVATNQVEGMRVWTVVPRRRDPQVRVIYVHGGGYLHPLTADYWRLVRRLASAPAEVIVPAYPLAPDADVDNVLPKLVGVVDSAHEADPDRPTVLMGDSAGGALVLAMALPGRAETPAGTATLHLAGVVALSPWLDATLEDPEVTDLESSDPMLAESGLRAAGRRWAGPHHPNHPMVSPVNADLKDLPPVDVFIGDRDILRPAVDRFARTADEQGVDLHVREYTAMFHVWMTRAIPEGQRTRRELAALLKRRAPSSSR